MFRHNDYRPLSESGPLGLVLLSIPKRMDTRLQPSLEVPLGPGYVSPTLKTPSYLAGLDASSSP